MVSQAHRWTDFVHCTTAVKFTWYDGMRDGKANAPYELLARATKDAAAADANKPAPDAKGKKNQATIDSPARWDLILVVDDGMMIFNRGSQDWIVTPGSRKEMEATVPKSIPRVENERCRNGCQRSEQRHCTIEF